MSNKTKVTLRKEGSKKQTVPVSQIIIPDLWKIAQAIHKNGSVTDGPDCADLILECWSLAHSLKRHIVES